MGGYVRDFLDRKVLKGFGHVKRMDGGWLTEQVYESALREGGKEQVMQEVAGRCKKIVQCKITGANRCEGEMYGYRGGTTLPVLTVVRLYKVRPSLLSRRNNEEVDFDVAASAFKGNLNRVGLMTNSIKNQVVEVGSQT